MSLKEYQRKRDFHRTAEPSGRRSAKTKEPRFVIQKHDASRLHYDFRLEMGGTLKSWAVPKGVPYTKGEKRLAVQVEDHPIAYADFEGIIPEGQYGGGTVMVWDAGTYEVLGGSPLKDLKEGKLHFVLRGRKLEGEWTLVKIARGGDSQWLLIKSGESMKPLSQRRDDESCLTGRSMTRIARDRGAVWPSKKNGSTPRHETAKTKPAQPAKSKKIRVTLNFVSPMKAVLLSAPPESGEWSYELKFDGFRALALKQGSAVQLLSRNQKNLAERFPGVADAVAEFTAPDVVLDGEIVALDRKGRPSFQLLQGGSEAPIVYYVFDLLQEGRRDLRKNAIEDRRERLETLLKKHAGDVLRYSATLGTDAARLLREVRRRGLEGIIGKRLGSVYEAGRRSPAWIKLKCVKEQEFVVGGYTPPEGTRRHFGALLIGVFEKGKLRFAGKCGAGFSGATLAKLHREMQRLSQDECPFADLPEKRQGRRAQNITPAEMKRCHWIRPQLVGQVRFTEWTGDGKLRHPVFLGLREDKRAAEVIRERANPPPK